MTIRVIRDIAYKLQRLQATNSDRRRERDTEKGDPTYGGIFKNNGNLNTEAVKKCSDERLKEILDDLVIQLEFQKILETQSGGDIKRISIINSQIKNLTQEQQNRANQKRND